MVSADDGFKIAVIIPPGGSPFILVPGEQVNDVRQLLDENGIGHTVGNFPSEFQDDRRIIYVGKLWEREQIQDVLDNVH